MAQSQARSDVDSLRVRTAVMQDANLRPYDRFRVRSTVTLTKIEEAGYSAHVIPRSTGRRSGSLSIEVPIPPHEALDSHFDRGSWREPDIVRQVGNVCICCLHVTWLHRPAFYLGLHAKTVFEDFDQ